VQAHEDELWSQGDDVEVGDKDKLVEDKDVPAPGARTFKRPRKESFEKFDELARPFKKDSTKLLEEYKPGTAPDLLEISQEGQERKATKADDAEVPEYLWHEHVFKGCGRNWMDEQKKALPQAAKLLQKGMLKHWKRKVLASF
jgi:hypothetical protein